MVVLQKLTARVFGASKGVGGNPVTIFISDNVIPEALTNSLARSCAWESVMIEPQNRFRFFLPADGAQVSFCAHAAMGAAYATMKRQNLSVINFETMDSQQQASLGDDDFVFLQLKDAPYKQESMPLMETEAMLDQLSLPMFDVADLPINAGLFGRPKTLVRLKDEDSLAAAIKPANPKQYADNCFMGKESTGLYLYCKLSENEFECRQFPSQSGYPEDPATGVAAAALAAKLRKVNETCTFRQGTTMGRPSLITIRNLELGDNAVSLECGGRVEIDKEETIKL